MRALLQRVSQASVTVEGEVVGEIGQGMLILLGVGQNDTQAQVQWLADKVARLRIFSDAEDKMNLSLLDIQGEVLVISQFTLYADTRRGRRPGFSNAAPPAMAIPLYEAFQTALAQLGLRVGQRHIRGLYARPALQRRASHDLAR